MAKRPIHTIEKYYDDTDDGFYQLRPDGTYEKISTNGADHSRIVDTDVALASSLVYRDTLIIPAATVTRQVITGFDNFLDGTLAFSVDLTAADTVTVEQSVDLGVTWFVVDPIVNSTGAQLGAAGIISADGSFLMPIMGERVAFTKTGTAATATIPFRALGAKS